MFPIYGSWSTFCSINVRQVTHVMLKIKTVSLTTQQKNLQEKGHYISNLNY